MKKVDIFILIDKSSSMMNRWAETIHAVEGYIEKLKIKPKSKIYVATFSTEGYDVIVDKVKLKNYDLSSIRESNIRPRGMTPLYDALVKLCDDVESVNPKRASVVILTDGAENASKNTQQVALHKIEKLKEQNYDVSMIGADFDTMGSAQSVNIQYGNSINTKSGNYATTLSATASKTNFYSSKGVTRSYTEKEREASS